MAQNLTISKVARQSGLSVPSIRFYEAQGIIPAPRRTDAGYRLYAPNDVRRLRLARRARLLGLSLPEVRALVERAFSSGCGAYAQEILGLVAAQRARIDQQIAELQALRGELDTLEREAQLVSSDVSAGLTVAECERCLLVDGEHGEQGYCTCGSTHQVLAPELLQGDEMATPLTEARGYAHDARRPGPGRRVCRDLLRRIAAGAGASGLALPNAPPPTPSRQDSWRP